MKECCKNQATPYCPQCGTKLLKDHPLKSLLTFLRTHEKATTHRVRHLKWKEWADAVEAALTEQSNPYHKVFQVLRGERNVVVSLEEATEKLPAGLYRLIDGVLTSVRESP